MFHDPSRPCIFTSRRTALGLVTATLVFISGCGITEYEKKLKEQYEQEVYRDKENENLAGPVRLSDKAAKGEEGVASSQFYFRPPKGVRTSCDDKPMGILSRFEGRDSGFLEVLVAAARTNKEETFQKNVLNDLKMSSKLLSEKKSVVLSPPPFIKPPSFRLCEENLATQVTKVYFSSVGGFQVAIAFRTPGPPSTLAKERVNYSLQSVKVGAAAAAAQRNTPEPAPTKPSKKS